MTITVLQRKTTGAKLWLSNLPKNTKQELLAKGYKVKSVFTKDHDGKNGFNWDKAQARCLKMEAE